MKELKELQKKIYASADCIKKIEASVADYQLQQATNSLLFAKAWLGKVQGAMGGTSPYLNDGKRRSVADIEPVDGASEGFWKNPEGITGIDAAIWRIDYMRQTIEEDISTLEVIRSRRLEATVTEAKEKGTSVVTRHENIAWSDAYSHLVEAKMWLGFALGSIRDFYQLSKVDA